MKPTVAFEKNARNVFLHVTTQCNLSCMHCYINKAQHGSGHVPLATLKAWLKKLYDPHKPTNVVFLGGEPTLHPDLAPAIKFARETGYASITVDTNGYLFHDILEKVTPKDVDVFSFSLDGPEAAVNDPIRGEGSFETVIKGMQEAKDRGFSVSLIYTVSAKNLEPLKQMPAFLESHPVDRFFIQVIGLRGSAKDPEKGAMQVTKKAWEETVREVALKVARMGIEVLWPKVYLEKDEPFECAGLCADNYFVFPNGRVYRCPVCEDYPIHAFEFEGDKLVETGGLNEARLFTLTVPEGCVMNRLIQPDNVSYDEKGKPCFRVACCLIKEKYEAA